jgi:3-oxoacyl-[acyl-carrier protein] reductase
MDLGLAGKVALVTAASKGMGKACAMGLAAEGAKVVMCARTETDLKSAAEDIRARTRSEVLAMPADVTKKDDVTALVNRAVQTFGGVDILVANAGGPPRGFFEDMTDEQWQGAFDVSLLSVVRLVRGVLPSMKAKRWGRILTIQSVSVKQPIPELLLSNAVRPGVAGMM